MEQLRFSAATIPPLAAYMDRLAAAGDGWVNVVPVLDEPDDRPTGLRFMSLFSGGGSGATMITWIPARTDSRGPGVQSLGITHLAGRRAVAALAAVGAGVPQGWTIEQDHARRGLIVHPPAGVASEAVMGWALRAVATLEASRQFTSWRADVYLPMT